MKKLSLVIALVLSLTSLSYAARIHPEEYYVNWWCSMYGCEQEYTMPDQTRCDCFLWNLWTIEFDFADKWYEAIGQALHYGGQIHAMPGIVLIIEDQEKDMKYWERLLAVVAKFQLPMQLWVIYVDSNGTPYL